MDKEQMPEASGSELNLPYAKPRLYKHGAIRGLTQAYLQSKFVGSKDMSRSSKGA